MPRTQIKRIAKNIVLIENKISTIKEKGMNPERIVAVKILIIIILVYSAIKIKANKPALYSVLKPETNSDSPSAKSNGVRLVSARTVIYHITAKGANIKIIHLH